MNIAPPCPICSASTWRQRSAVVYRRDVEPDLRSDSRRDYVRLRRRVLFEVWFQGAERVELTPQYCDSCGFMCYAPRADEADLQSKYDFLGQHERTGAVSGQHPREAEFDRRRAQRAFDLLRARHPRARTVLDIGGGDGRLLAPFLAAGFECSVLDHNPQPVAGVRRVGATWADLAPGVQFDLLVCNHVLEHVAQPVGFARAALAHLAPDGCAYVEIPLQIWGGIPIDPDPVTHVNFFTRRSLCHTLTLAGAEVLASRAMGGTYGQWRLAVAYAVIRHATRAGSKPGDAAGARLTRRLLDRPWYTRLHRRLWLQPQLDGSVERWRSFARRVQRKLRLAAR